ncbi:MAG TPA: response regulator [Chitinophagaceae bacterium]|jgi:signal transduction histidine kinase|nr:response regulator [Chitinophagaceae bacterium]
MKAAAPNKSATKSDIKILVVDDREDNLFSIEAILEKDQYTIIRANSGRAALKVLLNEHDFSLILMDVQMPELNGFETATIIYERDKLKHIPIIFITAYSNDEDHAFRGYKMGGVDYIYKPINPDLLRAKVAVFVELYRKNRQLQLQEKRLLATNKSLQKEIEERKISEEKVQRLNDQLTENNVHLKEMNEELDQFAYMASHDLQEPLRKIQMFSDKILVKKGQDEESERYFAKIISASRRMQSLINNLLDFSRHSVSSSDFKKTDMNQLLTETLGELEMDIEKTKATVNHNKLPVISVVPGLIQQLFSNIISNAIKFRKKTDPPVIDIKAEKVSAAELSALNGKLHGGVYHKITISDNGIGFDNQHNQEIFKVFKRLHNYQEFEGTGVGLSICKKIVEKHGGLISAESAINEGSTFTLVLPETQEKN